MNSLHTLKLIPLLLVLLVGSLNAAEPEWRIARYEDGSIKIKTPLVDKLRHGLQTHYNEVGDIVRTSNWANGKLHGETIEYRRDGSVELKTSYVNGKQHGEAIWYYPDGSVQLKHTYVNGVKQ